LRFITIIILRFITIIILRFITIIILRFITIIIFFFKKNSFGKKREIIEREVRKCLLMFMIIIYFYF